MTDLRERVARAARQELHRADLYSSIGTDLCTLAIADAVLAIARPAIIEEAAKVVDWYAKEYAEANVEWETGGTSGREFFTNMAAAIRKLAEKP